MRDKVVEGRVFATAIARPALPAAALSTCVDGSLCYSDGMSKKSGWVALLVFFAWTALADPTADQQKLAAANTGFAFDLLKQIAREQPDKNLFISPFSVSTVLQIVANGAAGDTRAEMQRVLKTDGLPPEALSAASLDLNRSLGSQTNVILSLANGIWFQEDIRLKPGFVATNSRFFQAELAPVDFNKSESAKIINDWADRHTHGIIKDVVQWPFDPLTRVILANAIYFKGKWARPFDKSATRPRTFHPAKGGAKPVPTMWQRGKFSYQEGDGFQAVRLPYVGGRLQMFLLLPNTNSGPEKLLAGLDRESWPVKVLSGFRDREGTLAVPRFKLEYDVVLNEPLQALGMRHAFEDADFSAMAGERLFVSKVKQKSFVEVNEEGTEAAAVTTVTMESWGIMKPLQPFEMIVDRPFFFVISDRETQSILFMGLVNDPAGPGGGK
jgi:serine protease inhibitor